MYLFSQLSKQITTACRQVTMKEIACIIERVEGVIFSQRLAIEIDIRSYESRMTVKNGIRYTYPDVVQTSLRVLDISYWGYQSSPSIVIACYTYCIILLHSFYLSWSGWRTVQLLYPFLARPLNLAAMSDLRSVV